MDLQRCSINSTTVRGLGLSELIEAVSGRGIPGVGLWRDCYAGLRISTAANQVRSSGLRVTSICRGGMFTHRDDEDKSRSADENRRIIDEAHAFDAECVVIVCGAPVGKDLDVARAQIRDGLDALAPYAQSAGIRLAIEPMHPMMVADRSAITSLAEANDLIQALDHENIGIALDAYHVFWDVNYPSEVQRASGRIYAVQVCDWVVPIQGQLTSRGMPGEGTIDLTAFVKHVARAGYDGLIEIEVLSDAWWAVDPETALDAAIRGFEAMSEA